MPQAVGPQEPPDPIPRRLTRAGALRREQQVQRLTLQEPRLEQRRSELHQILGRGHEPASRPLVAVVDRRRDAVAPGAVAIVELSTARNETVAAVGRRVAQAQGTKHVRCHVVQEVVSRRGFHHRRDEIPAVARVGESRAGREQERIVLEDRESVEHRGEAPVQEEFPILVMPDACEMAGEQASGDGVALVGERRHVALNGRVEIELPLLVQQGDGGGRERLRYAPDAKLRLARHGLLALGVRVPEPLRPHELTIHRDSHLHAGDMGREPLAHERALSCHYASVCRRHAPGPLGHTRRFLGPGPPRSDEGRGNQDAEDDMADRHGSGIGVGHWAYGRSLRVSPPAGAARRVLSRWCHRYTSR